MSVVHILAHFDDEYCCLPLIWQAAREGLDQRFIYLADYRDGTLGARRLAETHTFLARQGIGPEAVIALGLGTGAFDQGIHRAVGALAPALARALAGCGPVSRLITPAWEGGHMDHDACAFLAVRLAPGLGDPELRQFTLYNGPGLPGPLLRGGRPLAENGPVSRVALGAGEWARWMAAVRAFPSQAYAWSGIWPSMFAGMLGRGFGWQALSPARVETRPHAGSLFYERMFKVAYAEVRAALDAALPAPAAAPPASRRSDGSMAT